jgi:energy-coupling factor transport system permease protein
MKAQIARGADFESGNLLKRAKALVPLLVPLFISAFRRADDLAVAMECRCYRGGSGRTRMTKLHLAARDFVFLLTVALFIAGVVLLNIYFPIYTP